MVGLQTYRNPTSTSKDELAKKTLTEGSNTFTPILAASKVPTPAPASTLGLPVIYINVDLQKTTRLALKSLI